MDPRALSELTSVLLASWLGPDPVCTVATTPLVFSLGLLLFPGLRPFCREFRVSARSSPQRRRGRGGGGGCVNGVMSEILLGVAR